MQDVKKGKDQISSDGQLEQSVRELLLANITAHMDQEKRRKQWAAVTAISNAVHEIVAQYTWLCVCLTHLTEEEQETATSQLGIDPIKAAQTAKFFQSSQNLPPKARKKLLKDIQKSVISSSAQFLFRR